MLPDHHQARVILPAIAGHPDFVNTHGEDRAGRAVRNGLAIQVQGGPDPAGFALLQAPVDTVARRLGTTEE